jgi:hypothetical protein
MGVRFIDHLFAPPEKANGRSWTEVQEAERRRLKRLRDLDPDIRQWNPQGHLVGLALSGGGIRSATFCLGVLQAIAQAGWLRRFDLLSTVSGGGYIGAWLSALLHRQHTRGKVAGAAQAVEKILRPRHVGERVEEPVEIAFLRAYSNYLTPKLGLLSGDTLAAVAGYFRNLAYTLLLVMLAMAVALAIVHGPVAWLSVAVATTQGNMRFAIHQGVLQSLYMAAALCGCLLTLQGIDLRQAFQGRAHQKKWLYGLQMLQRYYVMGLFLLGLPLLFLGGIHMVAHLAANDVRENIAVNGMAGLGVLFWASIGTGLGRFVIEWAGFAADAHPETVKDPARPLLWAVLRSVRALSSDFYRYLWATAACVLTGVAAMTLAGCLEPVPPFALMFRGPAIASATLCLLLVVWLGVLGTTYEDQTPEWLSRLIGLLVGMVLTWTLLGVIVLNAFPVVQWLVANVHQASPAALAAASFIPFLLLVAVIRVWSGAARWLQAAVRTLGGAALLFLVLSVATIAFQGVLLSTVPQAHAPVIPSHLGGFIERHHTALTLVSQRWQAPPDTLGALTDAHTLFAAFPSLVLLLGLLAAAGIAFRYIDINEFSLQNLYRNRLVRCYLGAAHGANRLAEPFTRFDARDDVHLSALARQRPVHIINTAINLSQGDDLARQQRQAGSFTFSARHSGFWLKSTNLSDLGSAERLQGAYTTTDRLAHESGVGTSRHKGVLLGTAMATSGAAVSSQMGFASSRLLAFATTLLNLRLGRWFPNPAKVDGPQTLSRRSPKLAAWWFVRELLGNTNEHQDWIYLSDGGHFENLGIYELVRRRCRSIVSVDAGADPGMHYADLGNAIRKCRIDFGVEIQIDLTALTPTHPGGRPQRCSVIGEITYPPTASEPASTGRILYIKLGLPDQAGHLSPDIVAYSKQHPAFPHQSTTDQWFTEDQFESYRQLGYLSGTQALKGAARLFDPITSG